MDDKHLSERYKDTWEFGSSLFGQQSRLQLFFVPIILENIHQRRLKERERGSATERGTKERRDHAGKSGSVGYGGSQTKPANLQKKNKEKRAFWSKKEAHFLAVCVQPVGWHLKISKSLWAKRKRCRTERDLAIKHHAIEGLGLDLCCLQTRTA